MFRMIKITFKAIILVLAFIGFNAIGGEKYTEMVKTAVINFVQGSAEERAKKIGDFSKLNEEFQIDNTINIIGYKAVIADHKATGQKMVILNSGKKALLTQDDIKSTNIDKKLTELSEKFKYQGISIKDLKVTGRGFLSVYGQSVPYAKFEGHVTKLPNADIAGIIASVKTSDGEERLAFSINEKKKYSQLIANEFYKDVKEYKQ